MPKLIEDDTVFHAVIDTLAAYGYTCATTRSIAEAADMHEATLFRKYGSKFYLVEQAVGNLFIEVPLAKVMYTGNLRADLISIIEAYLETSEMVGDILPILLTEIPRNPEIKSLLDIPWKNIVNISRILEKYQEHGELKQEHVLTSISVLLGPLMVRHMILRADLDVQIPPVEAEKFIDSFLLGRQEKSTG